MSGVVIFFCWGLCCGRIVGIVCVRKVNGVVGVMVVIVRSWCLVV